MEKSAIISQDQQYRYSLSRIWDRSLPMLMIVGLNPSTADANNDDPTIRRCIGFAKGFGYGGFIMTNLFAYRSTNPDVLTGVDSPVGLKNGEHLLAASMECKDVMFAWGTKGSILNRDQWAINTFPHALCLGKTKGGHPKHPLYVKGDTPLIPFSDNE